MKNRGYTLIELILVVVIIGILASIAVQSLKSSDENQRFNRTVDEMEMLARGIVGDERLVSGGIRTDFGYTGDVGALPPNLDALATNPGGYATWNGPYIIGDFVENTEDYKRDAWNNPYTYSGGVTISSTGGGSSMTKQFANSIPSLASNTIYGIIRDRAGCPPWDSASNVTITIYYPDGGGSITSSSITPARSGEFSYVNTIPMGLHLIRAIVTGVDDTTAKYIAVNPGSNAYTELRFSSILWGETGSGQIEYVAGSANTSPSGDQIDFQIENTGSSPVTVTSMTIEYSSSPTAYYKRIQWNGGNVWNQQNPRIGSGDEATFNVPQILNASEVALIDIDTWKECPSGNCPDYDIHGTAFTVTFSSGDVISFTVP
jgi:prepilin-type N-terminal cleavage/methylation domain-containing protein